MPESEQRVLVVDDEGIICKLLAAALEPAGWEVVMARSAEEAFDTFMAAPFDLCIVDKNLPGESGVDLIARIRERDSIVGIIMITGYGSVRSALATLHHGIDAYIEKPFEDTDAIQAAAFGALGRARQRRDRRHRRQPTRSLAVLAASPHDEVRTWVAAALDASLDKLTAVPTSREAIEAVQQAPPDLLVLDATLKHPGVIELMPQLDEQLVGATFVILNDDPRLEEVIRYIELGVRAVIQRPRQASEAAERLGDLIGELRDP